MAEAAMTAQRPERPKRLSEGLKAETCERVIDCETIAQIARDEHMPDARTIHRALAQDEGFQRQHTWAKRLQLGTIADEMLFIADNAASIGVEQAAREIENLKHLLMKRMPQKPMTLRST